MHYNLVDAPFDASLPREETRQSALLGSWAKSRIWAAGALLHSNMISSERLKNLGVLASSVTQALFRALES